MSCLPKGWAVAHGEQLFELVRGVTYDKSDAINTALPGFIGILRATNIQDGRADKFDLVYAPKQNVSARQMLRENDLLIATSSGSRSVVGKLAEVKPGFEELSFGAFCSVARPHTIELSRWISYFAKSSAYRDYVESVAIGTNINNFRSRDINNISIPLPPNSENRRIVAKLDQLIGRTTSAREELAHIPMLVEHYKQAILRKAFSGSLTEVERDVHSWGEQHLSAGSIDLRSHDLLEDLPEGWCWSSMDQVTDVSGGLTKNAARNERAEQVPYLRVANVYANELRLEEIKVIGCSPAELQKTALEKDDLLIVEGNGSLEQIGRVAIWDGSIPGCSHQNHLIRARSKNIVPAKFLLYWLLSPVGRQAIESVASSSAGLHTLSITKVSGIPLPVPSRAEAERIVVLIEEAFDWIERVSGERDKAATMLEHLDSGLLRKAFRGELVPQDPADEPAELLLERLRAERGAQAPVRRGRRARAGV